MLLSQLSAQASPLSPEQVQKLQALTAELNPIQQAWVSGYLAANANTAVQEIIKNVESNKFCTLAGNQVEC